MEPPTTPIRRSSHVSRDDRIRIRTLRLAKFKYEAIANLLSLTLRQVQHACAAERDTPKKRPGRPPIITAEQFIKQSLENRLMPYRELARGPFAHFGVGEGAIGRSLRSRRYRRCIGKDIAKRLNWAQQHVDWTAEQWKSVLWTDETFFQVGDIRVYELRVAPAKSLILRFFWISQRS
jgi:hypothetical protein